jgi:hypothetical protein
MQKRRDKLKKRPTNVAVRTMVFKVAGISMRNDDGSDRQSIVETEVAPGTSVVLLPDPSNAYDSAAVKICVARLQIGFVPADCAPRISEYLTCGYEYESRVLDVTGGTDEKPTRGVNIEAAFWRGGTRPVNPYEEGIKNNNASRVARGLAPYASPELRRQTPASRQRMTTVFLFVVLVTFIVIFAASRAGK